MTYNASKKIRNKNFYPFPSDSFVHGLLTVNFLFLQTGGLREDAAALYRLKTQTFPVAWGIIL